MQAYNRLPVNGHVPPPSSPPHSPSLRSPRFRRSKRVRSVGPPPAYRTAAHRLAYVILSVLLRRQGIFLFAPLIYISGMLFYMGTVSFDAGPVVAHRPAPGSVYRSPQLFAKLRPHMDSDNSTADAVRLILLWLRKFDLGVKLGFVSSVCWLSEFEAEFRSELGFIRLVCKFQSGMGNILTIWKNSYRSGEWRSCIRNKSSEDGLPDSNGYIYVEANGGLNQQRASICNAVAVAGYLNATLVIPNFHYHSIWRDPSKFSDIYDEDYFVSTLQNEVRVVTRIPDYLMERYDHNMSNVYNFRIKAWSSVQYYKDNVLPRLLDEQ
ncbi:hypothetical protein KSS87_022337 [Heliosperma pusillum]|nr:hypothetical protein KSS87_022337 [Heliosperma pusillum]